MSGRPTCPKCRRPAEHIKSGTWRCLNPACSVLDVDFIDTAPPSSGSNPPRGAESNLPNSPGPTGVAGEARGSNVPTGQIQTQDGDAIADAYQLAAALSVARPGFVPASLAPCARPGCNHARGLHGAEGCSYPSCDCHQFDAVCIACEATAAVEGADLCCDCQLARKVVGAVKVELAKPVDPEGRLVLVTGKRLRRRQGPEHVQFHAHITGAQAAQHSADRAAPWSVLVDLGLGCVGRHTAPDLAEAVSVAGQRAVLAWQDGRKGGAR